MDTQRLTQLLEAVRSGHVDVPAALTQLRDLPYEDLDYGRLDHHRALRQGLPEVVFSQGKTPAQVGDVVARLSARNEAERQIVGVTTPFGEVAVKIKLMQGKALAAAPEYEDCRRIASEQGLPITTVYKAAEQAGINLLATMRAD